MSSAQGQPRPLIITLGGPVYCGQVTAIVRYLHASLVCPDYGRDGERSGASRARRVEDWGSPAYLAAVARLPDELERDGLKVSELILVGASYAGYAVAELAATHPALHPRALMIVDSFLDLRARFRALAPGQATRTEMMHVLGGTPTQRPRAYADRSPSSHLGGLAAAIEHGTRFVDVWSIGAAAAHEFHDAMCSKLANALWLRRLAHLLHRPVTGYVTRLRHAAALWYWWRQLLALAGLATTAHDLPASPFTFRQGEPLLPGSYCRA
jgi:pimeloyl-ACP methyl ester carboxylesterase